jgi:hypothetical protein
MGVEADFSRRLSRLTSKQRRELREMLGNPPDIRNVSEADWNRWEEERRRELTLILLAIILAALNQHAEELLPAGQQPSDETRTQAYRQALIRAQAIAADSARSSIQSAKEIIVASGELIRTGTAADIEGVLASALGPDRDPITAGGVLLEPRDAMADREGRQGLSDLQAIAGQVCRSVGRGAAESARARRWQGCR